MSWNRGPGKMRSDLCEENAAIVSDAIAALSRVRCNDNEACDAGRIAMAHLELMRDRLDVLHGQAIVGRLQAAKRALDDVVVLNELQREILTYSIGAKGCDPKLVNALGLAGEVGEVIEPIKKSFRDGTKINRAHLCEEAGDVFFYLCAVAEDNGITLSEVIFGLLAKLSERRRINVANGIKDRRS